MARKLERWLFVCTGNICRSPFAEAAARHLTADPGLRFSSAGTIAISGNPATRAGIGAAEALDIDLSAHRATHLSPSIIDDVDWVLGMEEEHVAAALALAPSARADLLHPSGLPIPDPYGGDRSEYLASYRLILDALGKRLA